MSDKAVYIYEGFYKSFAEVQKKDRGFSSDRWLDAQVSAMEAYRDGDCSTLFPADQYLAMAVAGLSSNLQRPVKILDIGGGLGGSFFWLNSVSPPGTLELDYVIMENPQIVAKAADLELSAQYPALTFITSVPDAHFDLVYFGSSIQYFEDWQDIINNALRSAPDTVLFSRTPLSSRESYVTSQNYYESRIPVQVIGQQSLEAHMAGLGYDLRIKHASASPVLGRFDEFPCRDIPDEYRFRFPMEVLFTRR